MRHWKDCTFMAERYEVEDVGVLVKLDCVSLGDGKALRNMYEYHGGRGEGAADHGRCIKRHKNGQSMAG